MRRFVIRTRVLIGLALVLAAAATVVVLGVGDDDGRRLGDWQLSGFNYTTWQPDTFASPTSGCQVAAMRATGADAVAIVATEYMAAPDATEIAPDGARSPTLPSVERAVRLAQDAGLGVWLKPHVDVMDDSWRGDIRPADRAAWYRSYRAFITRYADMAERLGAAGFIVGTELKTMSGDDREWRAIVRDVRARFDGEITYSANWDEWQDVRWWDAVDVLGPEAYFPLGGGRSVAELVAAWAPYVEELDRFRRRWDKDVLFPEIGFASVEGAALAPHSREGEPDVVAQQRAYEATLRVWGQTPWVRGMFWWHWLATGEDAPTDHTPQGKPAARTLTDWQGGTGAAAACGNAQA